MSDDWKPLPTVQRPKQPVDQEIPRPTIFSDGNLGRQDAQGYENAPRDINPQANPAGKSKEETHTSPRADGKKFNKGWM